MTGKFTEKTHSASPHRMSTASGPTGWVHREQHASICGSGFEQSTLHFPTVANPHLPPISSFMAPPNKMTPESQVVPSVLREVSTIGHRDLAFQHDAMTLNDDLVAYDQHQRTSAFRRISPHIKHEFESEPVELQNQGEFCIVITLRFYTRNRPIATILCSIVISKSNKLPLDAYCDIFIFFCFRCHGKPE